MWATDVSAKRLAQTGARMKRYAYADRVKCGVADAMEPKGVEGKFDLILCDVPCSGTGTLAGNPEIRHRLKVEEFARQAERQRGILAGALKRLGTGGRLVYSTCSLEPEECERVVEAVMAEAGWFAAGFGGGAAGGACGAGGVVGGGGAGFGGEGWGRCGHCRGVHGCDGFFAVVLERE